MKKNYLLFLFLLPGIFDNYHCVAQVMFQKNYGTSGQEFRAESGQQTSDGGYIMVGTQINPGSQNDIYLVKIDLNGNLEWSNSYGGSDIEQGYSVKQTTDGGFVITGTTQSFGLGNPHVYLIRTDDFGNLLWSKAFSGTGGAIGYDVIESGNGDFIVTGICGGDLSLVKTNASGDLQWAKIFNGTGIDGGYCIQRTSDGGYIISGNNQVGGLGTGDVYLLKVDGNGSLQWSKRFSSGGQDDGNYVLQTTDGGYMIAATTNGFGSGNNDIFLIRTDSIGDYLWSKTFGGTLYDWALTMQNTSDGGYIVTGHTNSFGAGNYDMYLLKLDANGDSLWTKTYGSFTLDEAQFVEQTNDGGYVIFGGSIPPNAGDMFLVKTDSLGNSGCNQGNPNFIISVPQTQVSTPTTTSSSMVTTESTPATVVTSSGTATTICTNVGVQETTAEDLFLIVPNPSNGNFQISFKRQIQNQSIEIFNFSGEKIFEVTNLENQKEVINMGNAVSGIYIIRLIADDKIYFRKLVVAKN